MDRASWTAVVICIALLIGWHWYVTTYYPPQPRPAEAAATASPSPDAGSSPKAAATADDETPALPATAASITAKTESLYSNSAEYVFNNDAGGIEEVRLFLHQGEESSNIELNENRKFPIGAIGFRPDEPLGGFEMTTDPSTGKAVFSSVINGNVAIQKEFVVPADQKGQYLTDLNITFTNTSAETVTLPEYFVSCGEAAPVHASDLPTYTRFDWFRDGKMTSIDVNWFPASTIPLIGIQTRGPRAIYEERQSDIAWAAVTSQYFCTILESKDKQGVAAWATRRFDRKEGGTEVYAIQGALGMPGISLQPGESKTVNLQLYTGPKEYAVLKGLGNGEEHVLNFGFFSIISVGLLWSMNALNGIFHSYAAAIIVLTILIKLAMWPLQNKATQSMKRMSLLSPKMTELREKYKDDPQKMNEELMKLYKEYGVNPFEGCLPLLVQIPIFFGFYSMLGTAIELRNSSFLWVQDLSQPDTVFHVMGFPINVLPLVMAGTMVWQMAISPKSGDAIQQRVMYFMPIIFIVFCYNFASALSLYWTTQNLFSIFQLYLTRNQPLPKLEKKSDIARREAATAAGAKKKRKRRPV